MHRLNVRCCCQPQKILGTLELRSLDRIQRLPIISLDTIAVLYSQWSSQQPVETTISYHTIQLKYFGNGELAVYSDDRPVEFWRQFSGFIENTTGE